MQFQRSIKDKVINDLFKGKVIIIYGARQVGKTTLMKEVANSTGKEFIYFNGDEAQTQSLFKGKNANELKNLMGITELILIDEAQRIQDIGLALKILVDSNPQLQIIASGSSSFDLLQKISEPLTGRSYDYHLFPISESEISDQMGDLKTHQLLETRLQYGCYPEVVKESNLENKKRFLLQIANNYLLKDVLQISNLKRKDILHKLLSALAFQVGKEISTTEIGNLVGIDKKTVEHYLYILEEAFVIFTLKPFSRNLRKEIGKMRKVYFYDIGIRNALINNFNPIDLRNDIGELWENYLISEILKHRSYNRQHSNFYFWRTYDQQEIDLIEERDGKLMGYEIKWSKKKAKIPKIFLDTYKNGSIDIIHQGNYQEFINS